MSLTVRPRNQTLPTLKAFWHEAPPSRFLDYKDFLRALHAIAEKHHSRYTYHQFSADLGFASNNAAYMIVHGYRKINEEQVQSLVSRLGLSKNERRYLWQLIAYTDCQVEDMRRDLFQDLVELKENAVSSDVDRLLLRFYKDWYHAAIFELVGLPDFSSDPAWIASRFYKRLTVEQVTQSLSLLENLGLIVFDADAAKHVKKKQSLSTGDEVRGLAVVGYHLQMLAMAQGAMWQVPEEEREIGALTLSVSEDVAQRLKEDVRLLRRYAVFLSEQCHQPSRIVQMNVQLFSMTRGPGT